MQRSSYVPEIGGTAKSSCRPVPCPVPQDSVPSRPVLFLIFGPVPSRPVPLSPATSFFYNEVIFYFENKYLFMSIKKFTFSYRKTIIVYNVRSYFTNFLF